MLLKRQEQFASDRAKAKANCNFVKDFFVFRKRD